MITVIGGAVISLAWVLLIVFSLAAIFGGTSRLIREIEGKARKNKAREITNSNVESFSMQRKIENLEAAIRIQDSQENQSEPDLHELMARRLNAKSSQSAEPDINQDLYDQIEAAAKEYNATRANSSAGLASQRSQELDLPEDGLQSEDSNIERGTE